MRGRGGGAGLAGVGFCPFQVAARLAVLPGGERAVCARVCIKGAINTHSPGSVNFPHKTMFGEISLEREFWFETERKQVRKVMGK